MVDCGFSAKETVARLKRREIDPYRITAILATHEHSDHIKGIPVFANRYQVPVFATNGTLSKLQKVDQSLVASFKGGATLSFDDITVRSVSVPHDAKDPTQFVFRTQSSRFGLLTDIGHPSDSVVEQYQHCDALFVESNYDYDMLWNGEYPLFLKQRISGNRGHLSNDQTEEFLGAVMHDNLKTLVIGHISESNNSSSLLHQKYENLGQRLQLLFASQRDGTDWISV